MKRLEKLTYRSVHTDYLRFAVNSFFESASQSRDRDSGPYVNRHVIDTIRYSFDCLEGAIKFVFFAGSVRQLPIEIPTTWLTRYLHRHWTGLSLPDAIGLLSFAWTGQSFWQSSEQFQLFEDIRKLRGALTHPKPIATKVFKLEDHSTFEELLEPDLLIHSKPIAKFHASPDKLDFSDAEQALEILLHHLIRIQQLFFQGTFSTQFAYFDDATKEIVGIPRLLKQLNCRFSKYWTQ